jgi:hypothetical protein
MRLGRLLGVPVSGEGGGPLAREELFAGWRLFFERLAAVHPVVLLVEDAQYADSGLLDFLDHLVDWVRDLPVYMLVLGRPELSQARPGFGNGRNRITLTLDPLDVSSMDRLVDALVPGMPPAAAAEILRAEPDADTVRALDALAGLEVFAGSPDAVPRAELAALRGDAATAETLLAELHDMRASEDAQDKAFISEVEAIAAAARGRPRDRYTMPASRSPIRTSSG